MVRAIERGLSLFDFQELTIGMILDYVITYNNLNSDEAEEDKERMATQRDFDNF